MEKYDVAVIGSGPGGYIAALKSASLGFKTICIEKATLGGTCLNVGCIPSKALLESSEYFAFLKTKGKEHGLLFSDLSFDFSKMMERKEKIVKELAGGIGTLFKRGNVFHLQGEASFSSSHTLDVKTKEGAVSLAADRFIVASGSEPVPLSFLPFDEEVVVSSTGALGFSKVPKNLVVIGGGVIGVELASVYARLGSKVSVVEMLDQICFPMSREMSKSLLEALKKQGIVFYLESKLEAAKVEAKTAALTIGGKETLDITADKVLVSVGRRPLSKGLNLERIGVSLDAGGFVEVDGNFCSSVENIYAIGDLIRGPMLAHRASEEGYAVAEHFSGKDVLVNYMAIPSVVYTRPEAASLGVSEEEASDKGLKVISGKSFFRANGRAKCLEESEGFVKVIGEKTSGALIGMEVLGPGASELIGSGVVAIQKKMTIKELSCLPMAHPTLSEAIKEASLAAV